MPKSKVIVGLGSCGIAAGANKVYAKILELQKTENIDIELGKTSCIGMCYREPLVEIIDETGAFLYGEVNQEKIIEILNKHISQKKPIKEYIVQSNIFETKDDEFTKNQIKISLRNCGYIDPENIGDYEKRDGYKSLKKIANEKITRQDIIKIILDAELRGRGGGGFSTGLKWRYANNNKTPQKYIICNADEGDPGAFMDRALLEGDPHSIIEGMIIGAYAIEATTGIIYCRAEYPLALKRLNIAIEQAKTKKYLGKNILGIKDFNFDLHIKEGAGAFVCGEETALIASIEGKRGMPYKRPPFPAEKGLWNQSTNINNVETFANVPWIVLKGAKAFVKYGTEKSKGTKVFALAGKINRSGLVEVPMGISIKDIIFKLGGGIKNNKKFKAVQLGGPSGGCIPAHLADTIVDFESVNATGAIMGSGGMVVMDETTCMVDIAKYFLEFTRKESCGKCTFCRIGTKRMLEIIENITQGKGQDGDIDRLEELAYQIKNNSLCGLGQTAPNPVLSTLKYFRTEYEIHIYDKKCPSVSCKNLLTYKIDKQKCTGCTICVKNCPVNAISGERKQIHFIAQDKCIKCGICYSKCKFKAINLF